jgi:hypothetical protein
MFYRTQTLQAKILKLLEVNWTMNLTLATIVVSREVLSF